MWSSKFQRSFGFAWIGVFLLPVGLASTAYSADHSAIAALPYSTPPGITLVSVHSVTGGGRNVNGYLWRRLGDSTGKPLYTYDRDGNTGKSVCVDECAKEFPPFSAPPEAVAYGDWSLVDRGGAVIGQELDLTFFEGLALVGHRSLGGDRVEFLRAAARGHPER